MAVATAMLVVAPSASAFSVSGSGSPLVLATGDGADVVTIGRGAGGEVTIEVDGQELESAPAAGCTWDPDAAVLSCPAATAVEAHLGGGADALTVDGGVAVTAFGEAGGDDLETAVAGSILDGGADDDTLDASGVSSGSVRLAGGADNDAITGGGGDDVLAGGEDQDEIDGHGGSDRIDGDAGNDTLQDGPDAGSTIDGGGGDDAITVLGSQVTTIGGEGRDEITVLGAAATVDAGLADDVIDASGAAGGATIDGGGGADQLTGSRFADRIDGGDGDDQIDGVGGADALLGRAGRDQLADGDDAGSRLEGGPDADVLTVSGPGSEALGDDGDDQIDGSASTGGIRVSGGAGQDTIVGGRGPDRLAGDDGEDRIDDGGGGGAASQIDGGAGTDEIAVSAAGSTAAGGDGPDRIDAAESPGPVVLIGGAADDVLIGGAGGDQLFGEDGDDTLSGMGGLDRLSGGTGQDTVTYAEQDGPVILRVGTPPDFADGRSGERDDVAADVETVIGSDVDDNLTAAPGGTTLRGGDGNDQLHGDVGSDLLSGENGDDTLDGAGGPDVLEGGSGEDTVSYAARRAPLTIDMSSRLAIQGEAGEGDRFVDPIEQIVGGAAGDVITGNPGTIQTIAGQGGNDTIDVRERNSASPDTVSCGPGGDDRASLDAADAIDLGPSCEWVEVDGVLTRAVAQLAANQQIHLHRYGRRWGASTTARIRVACPRGVKRYCSVGVSVRGPNGRSPVLRTTSRRRVLPGRSRMVTLRALNATGVRRIAARKRAVVAVVARDALGRGTITKATMPIVRKAHPAPSRTGRRG